MTVTWEQLALFPSDLGVAPQLDKGVGRVRAATTSLVEPGHSACPGATPTSPTLWHFTCAHHAPAILAVGTLAPNRHPFMPRLAPMVWLTEDPAPTADDVGLTASEFVSCNRREFRFRVIDTRTCERWSTVVDLIRCTDPDALDPNVVADLERYGRPETWWVSQTYVPVVPA